MKARAREILSTMYMEFGNLLMEFDCNDDASRFLMKTLKMSRDSGDTHGVRRALQSLGKLLSRQGEFNAAERFFRECLELHEPDNPGYDLFPLMSLVELYRFMGRYEDAEKAAAEIEEKIDLNEPLKPYLYAVLTGLLMDTGQYRKCIEVTDRLMAESGSETRGEIWIELNARRAWCYMKTGEHARALEILKSALSLAEDRQVPYRESSIHAYLSFLQAEYGDDEKALDHARMAVDKAVSVNSELCLSLASEALGKALINTGNPAEGMDYLKHSLRLARVMGHQQDVCAALLSVARAHLKAGQYNDAMSYCYKLLQFADPGLQPQRREASLVMAQAYAKKGLDSEARLLVGPVIDWSSAAGAISIHNEATELMARLSS